MASYQSPGTTPADNVFLPKGRPLSVLVRQRANARRVTITVSIISPVRHQPMLIHPNIDVQNRHLLSTMKPLPSPNGIHRNVKQTLRQIIINQPITILRFNCFHASARRHTSGAIRLNLKLTFNKLSRRNPHRQRQRNQHIRTMIRRTLNRVLFTSPNLNLRQS